MDVDMENPAVAFPQSSSSVPEADAATQCNFIRGKMSSDQCSAATGGAGEDFPEGVELRKIDDRVVSCRPAHMNFYFCSLEANNMLVFHYFCRDMAFLQLGTSRKGMLFSWTVP